MAEIAKQIGVFIMAFIIIGVPFINGLLITDTSEKDVIDIILTICSAVDLLIVIVLIHHCM